MGEELIFVKESGSIKFIKQTDGSVVIQIKYFLIPDGTFYTTKATLTKTEVQNLRRWL